MSADSCYPQRRALTLIEVVVGLALLSMVLVTSLVGIRRLDQQAKTAEMKLLAVDVADRLLTAWYEREGIVPVHQAGTVLEKGSSFQWRTQPVPVPQLGVAKVRIIVRESDIEKPLVSVEVLATPPIPMRRAP